MGILSRLMPMKTPADCAGFADCMELRKEFQTHIDGELDAATAKRIEERLEACKGCGMEHETYLELKTSLTKMRPPSPEALDRLEDFAENLASGTEPTEA